MHLDDFSLIGLDGKIKDHSEGKERLLETVGEDDYKDDDSP